MAKLKCSNCGKDKGLLAGLGEPWYRCSKCGVICNKCDTGSTLGNMLGVSKKRCPKCGLELKPLD